LLIILGFSHADWNFEHFTPTISTAQQMTSPSFAVSLIYVIFAYSGWNASAYVASELKNPERDVPLSIILGTVFVTIVYVLINMMFLMVAPINELMVNPETMMPKELVVIAGSHFLPPIFATISGLIIAFMLISSMSAMVVAGPRVLRSMVSEYLPSQKGKDISTIPVKSIWIQTGIAVLMILTSTYDTLITFTTFLITLFSSLTALAAIYARFSMRKAYRPYRMFAYPATPVLFLLINLWIMQKTIQDKPTDMYYVAGILITGIIAYIMFSTKKSQVNA
jgi:APA family basic amino acid/polyamine antiporter